MRMGFQSTQDAFSTRASSEASSGQAPSRRLPGRPRPGQADLSHTIKDNLRRLKNVLKLPKVNYYSFFPQFAFIYFDVIYDFCF